MEPQRIDRKLAAILLADVAGYSRLMEADEEGTLSRLNTLFQEVVEPQIEKNRGRVVKHMGDGILVEFGSVVDAVRCGAAIQRDIRERNEGTPEPRRMELRIGINLGDIIHQDGDIFGDGVNVAARLQQQAEPGGITISEDVYRQVETKLPLVWHDLGGRQVKNLRRTIRSYRLLIDSEKKDHEAPADTGARVGRRWAVPLGLGILLIAVGLVAWVYLDREQAVSSGPECTDHLGLPVAAEDCPSGQN
ncbi:MAG: adenylate/guanylate cyclase domain-containing protein [Proteobacteria bacterium]|nr:adenylate/guanylate cyclase domain-containing protein [Pseudomonadota bacterium]